ncbi:MAG: PepSY domain-containing protein [Caryophanon sp.]|nr:PepSY domain-containing protein [Caryophanon sp.]
MKKLIVLTVTAIGLIVLTLVLLQTNERITLQQAEQKIAQAYNAEVLESHAAGESFTITFSNATGQYDATVNAHGQIVALTQTIAADVQEAEREEETTPEEEVKPTSPSTPTQITSDEALRIATARFAGSVEDIEFVASSNGGYYDIELESGEQEVTMQVHALTGDILSVVYDD